MTNSQLPRISGDFQALIPDGYAVSGVFSYKNWVNANKRVAPNTANQATIYGISVSFGNDESHLNLQPYITVYQWLRVT